MVKIVVHDSPAKTRAAFTSTDNNREAAATIDFATSTARSSCSTATRSWASVSLLMRYCNSTPRGGKSLVTVKTPANFRYVRPGPPKLTCCPTE